MKVFIHYQPRNDRDTVEGVRLRKTLKGACELASIAWVSSLQAEPDIAHFISPNDLKLLRKMKKRGVKCIVSAFYCENDPYACFLNRKNPQNPAILGKGRAICQEADLVLVPNESFAEFAKKQGITTEIRVCYPAVDIARFVPYPGEERIFPRYYRVREDQSVVMCSGSYRDAKCIERFMKIASLCPEIEFYFFGAGAGQLSLWGKLDRLNRKSSKNCHFVVAAMDDVYRSAIYCSLARLFLDSHANESTGVLDAFAAKLQVITLRERSISKWIIPDVNAKVFQTDEEIACYLRDLRHDKAARTVDKGYEFALSHRLEAAAANLKNHYESLLIQE